MVKRTKVVNGDVTAAVKRKKVAYQCKIDPDADISIKR